MSDAHAMQDTILVPVRSQTKELSFTPAGGYESYTHLCDFPELSVWDVFQFLFKNHKDGLPYLAGDLSLRLMREGEDQLIGYVAEDENVFNIWNVLISLEDAQVLYERIVAYQRWGFVPVAAFLADIVSEKDRVSEEDVFSFLKEMDYFDMFFFTRHGEHWSDTHCSSNILCLQENKYEILFFKEALPYLHQAFNHWMCGNGMMPFPGHVLTSF